MVRLCGQEFIVESAAVADAVSLPVEGQAGHQHQGSLIVGNGAVGDGLGDPGIALFHLTQILHENEFHLVAVAFGHGYTFAIGQRLFQHGHGADLLVVGQVTVDGFGILIGLGLPEQTAQFGAFCFDLSGGHGPFLLPDHTAQFLFIHGSFPPEWVLLPLFHGRGGTSGTTAESRSDRGCPVGKHARHSARRRPTWSYRSSAVRPRR